MSAGTLTPVHAPTNGDGALVVRPQATIGAAAETQRAVAEIQAALTVAKASRRDEVDCVDRIKTACQRPGLAEKAEYTYSRGGSEITGPSIDILTVIANCWGNIQFGFRELSQAGGESVVEAFAWDLESNSKRTVVFTVPHKRVTRQGSTQLTDPRDIYELVANNAQRRVRACLEAVIPPDVVEDAVAQCRETLRASADVTPDSIKKTVEAFARLGVTKDQIEKRLGRRIDSMQPAQLVSLRRIYKSIQDGMSKPGDWFEQDAAEAPASATDAAKDALRKKAKAPVAESPPEPIDAGERPQTPTEVRTAFLDIAAVDLREAATLDAVDAAEQRLLGECRGDAESNAVEGLANVRRGELKNKSGKQKPLV